MEADGTRGQWGVVTVSAPVALALPLRGRCRVVNSPANRVPSHGIAEFGLSYAIDLVPVGDDGLSAPRGPRSWLASEPPESFVGFGQPVHAPARGVVVWAHDGVPDGGARRAPLVALGFALTQAQRVRAGVEAVAGNHVVVELDGGAGYLWIVHLRRGSVRVEPGTVLAVGDQLGEVGNSGNTTEPHVHLHVASSAQWRQAQALPLAFTDYRTVDPHGARGAAVATGLPRTGEIIEPA